jgi:hypothetical protein
MSQPVFDPDIVRRSFDEALAMWGADVTLSPPDPLEPGSRRWDEGEPLAFIDLATRRIVVNLGLVRKLGIEASLTAILAHEIGHHVRFPHTLGLVAALEVLERRLIPGLRRSLTNLYFDLQVNEVVGHQRAEALCAVYRAFNARPGAVLTPLFCFYLAIYEELWGPRARGLVGPEDGRKMDADYPGWRGDARMFAQTFYALDDNYLSFVYFCSRFIRYLPDPAAFDHRFPLAGDVPSPDADDYADALSGHAQVERAIDEAVERGWMSREEAERACAADPDSKLADIERVSRQRPGHEVAPFRLRLVSREYARLVERHLLRLPTTPERPQPEPYLPTTTEEWGPGDGLQAIDWTQSVLAMGPLAVARPLRRELEPDDPIAVAAGVPSVEIYLDTSGSMPDPSTKLNAFTLAAQILSASTIRAGGTVRAVVYSSGPPMVSSWMRDEQLAREALLHYAGGGTEFPFEVLEQSVADRPDAIRVVISDSDFLWNAKQGDNASKLARGVARCARFVALLSSPGAQADVKSALGAVLRMSAFALVRVESAHGLAKAATALGRALFGA